MSGYSLVWYYILQWLSGQEYNPVWCGIIYFNGCLGSNITQFQALEMQAQGFIQQTHKVFYQNHWKTWAWGVSLPLSTSQHTECKCATHILHTHMLKSAAHALATLLMHTDTHIILKSFAAYVPLGLISGVCLQVFTKTLAWNVRTVIQ